MGGLLSGPKQAFTKVLELQAEDKTTTRVMMDGNRRGTNQKSDDRFLLMTIPRSVPAEVRRSDLVTMDGMMVVELISR